MRTSKNTVLRRVILSTFIILSMAVMTLDVRPAQAAPFVYVTNNDANTVSVIDRANNTFYGLAAAVSQVLTDKGFATGGTGNNEGGHITRSQVQAAKADDLGAQAVSKELGGLPVVENASVSPGSARVVLAGDYTGPGSGLDGSDPTLATVDPAAAGTTDSTDSAPAPSPILTAGSNDPECVN